MTVMEVVEKMEARLKDQEGILHSEVLDYCSELRAALFVESFEYMFPEEEWVETTNQGCI